MVSHVRVRLVNGLCHGLTDGNGLIGFADFVGIAQTFYVRAAIGRGECLSAREVSDCEACPRGGGRFWMVR